MSRDNWVSPNDITVFCPETPEQLEAKREDIEKIYGAEYDPSFWDWATKYHPSFWIFYLDNEPVGLIRRDFFKRSVELHGQVREGFMDRGIQYYAVLASLNHTFFMVPRTKYKRGYNRVIIGVPDGNKFVQGFARLWKFRKTAHREGDVTYYRLTKDEFLRNFADAKTNKQAAGLATDGVQERESSESQSGDSEDSLREH